MNRLLFVSTILIAGCSPAKQEPQPLKTVPDYFERKLQCFHTAEQSAKERFGKNNSSSGFTEVIYSPKRQSCVVQITQIMDKFMLFSVEDLLTYQTLWVKTCTIKDGCAAEAGMQQKTVMDELR